MSRKQKWRREEEERVSKIPDPSIPQGHVIMPSDEKRRTLEILMKCKISVCIMVVCLYIIYRVNIMAADYHTIIMGFVGLATH